MDCVPVVGHLQTTYLLIFFLELNEIERNPINGTNFVDHMTVV